MVTVNVDVKVPSGAVTGDAYLQLQGFDEDHGKGKGLDGYRPYRVVGWRTDNDTIQVSCERRDAMVLVTTLEDHLGKKETVRSSRDEPDRVVYIA